VSVRTELGITVFDTLEEGLKYGPAVVVVASPTDQHVPIATAAATRGCHLFVEKPLSFSLAGVPELCAAIEARKLVSMTACNMRFHPGPARVKALLDAGVAGLPMSARIQVGSYLPNWRARHDYRTSYSASVGAGGAVLDCIHEIDLALWYFGPAEVLAAVAVPAHSLGLDTDGLAEVLLGHASGMLSSVHLNFVQRDYHRSCAIVGTKGTIYWSFSDGQVRVFGESGTLADSHEQPAQWQINQMYVDEMRHFLTAVADRRPTMHPVPASIEALSIALAVRTARRMCTSS